MMRRIYGDIAWGAGIVAVATIIIGAAWAGVLWLLLER